MSRRAPNPAAERAAKNQATIKSLLKLEPNKICADCKRNKHPRWASWNLGVFICIRCSGIHRGMGTHISKVKSVDLDSWTDEQMQSILSWGNARANKYFEAKLAPGHVPSEAKIENFIRTKYELKRWAMEGPRPDPATLGADADDDVPLSVVKEKQAIDRKASVTGGAAPQAAPAPPPKAPAPEADLIGGDDIPRHVRAQLALLP
uniref:Arf-GAP domain-containing protein n=1 Tax=Bionectria ochroleuca TaxID=29856 RepID=A0A8H7NF99_BIOOC